MRFSAFILLILSFFVPEIAHAYIGPGAGFAFLGSTLIFVVTAAMAVVTIALWPLQWVYRKVRRKMMTKNPRAKRIVILGLDGLEPTLVDRFMADGSMPNLLALSQSGSYERLRTTIPALSPVAWSSFQTGVNPGAHNIFDFLTRDKRFCLPQLASTEIDPVGGDIRIFGIKLPFFGGPSIRITRKSIPFWHILGKHGIFSNVIRVPISYPPEKFNGNILSAMCTPDIKGTQGTFTIFTTKKSPDGKVEGGQVRSVENRSGMIACELEGPPREDGKGFYSMPFAVKLDSANGAAELQVGKLKIPLSLNEFSDWVEVEFPLTRRKKVSGICRFCLREASPDFTLYVSPINIHPEKPAMPVSRPLFFSGWLAKRNGLYGTLGLMEDTWGRNEYAIDDARFLDQTYLTHAERERMYMDALDRTREGVCVGVFDASDRIQHMFWRYMDDAHPSPREDASFASVIPDMYKKMDELVGRVKAKLRPDDVFIVLSDHGFSSFRRCVALNAWLRDNGYLVLKDGKREGADYFRDVDWEKTTAFAVGLSGLYINKKGRERLGTVDPKAFQALKDEISLKLEALIDGQTGAKAVSKVYDTAKAYRGLYADEAPDLIVGYAPGYRVSWDSVTGTVESEIFSDNLKAWSGDHHIDPKLVPGILFTNRKITHAEKPHIVDIAPTALDLFGVKIPKHMEGKVLF